MLKRFIKEQTGQDMVEYGLLAALISISAVLTLRLLGPLIIDLYSNIEQSFGP